MTNRIGIDKMTVHTIITVNFSTRKICFKLVLKFLTDEQMQRQESSYEDLLQHAEEDPGFLDNVIMGNESCFLNTTRKQMVYVLNGTLWHQLAQKRFE